MGIGILVTGAAAVLIGEAIFGDRTVAWWVVAAICGTVIYRLLVALALRVGLQPIDLRLVTAVLLLIALTMPRWRLRVLEMTPLLSLSGVSETLPCRHAERGGRAARRRSHAGGGRLRHRHRIERRRQIDFAQDDRRHDRA